MRSGIGVAGEEVATITPNSTLSLTVDDGIECPVLAEGVEEVGADGFCATIVPVG